MAFGFHFDQADFNSPLFGGTASLVLRQVMVPQQCVARLIGKGGEA